MSQIITIAAESTAANATSANLVAGRLNEFLEGPSVVSVYATAAAVGILMTFNVGNEVFVQDQEISNANRFPTRDQDLLAQGVGGAGERITVILRNRTAGAIVSNILIQIDRVR